MDGSYESPFASAVGTAAWAEMSCVAFVVRFLRNRSSEMLSNEAVVFSGRVNVVPGSVPVERNATKLPSPEITPSRE